MTNKNTISSALLILTLTGLGAVALSACSEKKVDQKIDDHMAKTAPISGPNELQQDSAKLISTAPGLSTDQRAKLTTIQTTSSTKLSALREESLKLRELLLQEVVRTDKYDDREVSRIKSRLKTVEKKRLETLFSAIDQANDALGHDTERHDVMNSMLRMDEYDGGFSSRR